MAVPQTVTISGQDAKGLAAAIKPANGGPRSYAQVTITSAGGLVLRAVADATTVVATVGVDGRRAAAGLADEGQTATVPAKALYNALRHDTKAASTLTVAIGDGTVQVGTTLVDTDETGEVEPLLIALRGTDFATIDTTDLGWVAAAQSTDTSRPVITQLSVRDGRAGATDGYRIHQADVDGPEGFEALISQAAVHVASSVTGATRKQPATDRVDLLRGIRKGTDAGVTVTVTGIAVTVGNVEVVAVCEPLQSRQRYPDLDGLFPDSGTDADEITPVTDVDLLTADAMVKVSADGTGFVKAVGLPDGRTVVMGRADSGTPPRAAVGDCSMILTAAVGWNARFLRLILTGIATTTKANITAPGGSKPVTFTTVGGTRRALLMPVLDKGVVDPAVVDEPYCVTVDPVSPPMLKAKTKKPGQVKVDRYLLITSRDDDQRNLSSFGTKVDAVAAMETCHENFDNRIQTADLVDLTTMAVIDSRCFD